MKHIVAAAMPVMLVILCVLLVTESRNVTNEYETYINKAQSEEEKGLYLNAISYYQEALGVYDKDQKIKYQIVKDYKDMGNIEGWLSAVISFIDNYPEDTDKSMLAGAYRELLGYYYGQKDYDNLIPLLVKLRDEKIINEDKKLGKLVEKYYDEVASIYTVTSCGAGYISDFYNGYAVMEKNNGRDKYLVAADGSVYTDKPYEDIYILDAVSGYSVVKEDEVYKVYTTGGYLKEIDQNGLTDAKYYNNSYIVGKKDGKYRMYSYKFEDAGFGGWDDFHLIAPGIACVKEDGKESVLVGSRMLEDEDGGKKAWDRVVYCERGIKENGSQLFVGSEGSYDLINIDTDKVQYKEVAKGFEDVDAFCTTEPAAVKKDGKWGFISTSGEMVIEPAYEEAKSFSYGYAPVKISGKWSLIDKDGREVINAGFAGMGSPAESGIVPVSEDGKTWDLISLFIKNYN